MKRLFRAVIASGLLAAFALFGGCATTAGSVDYATLVKNTCTLAGTEIATLQALPLSTSDATALEKVASVVTPTCAAVSTNPQDTYAILATVMVSLTTLYVTYHQTPPASPVSSADFYRVL